MAGNPLLAAQRTGLRYFFNEQIMSGFAGGLNLQGAPTELQPNESPSCWNVTLDELGGVVKRLGYSKWNASAVSNLFSDSYYSTFLDLGFWYSPADGKLYKDDDGTLTSVHTFTVGSRVSLVDFAGAIYVAHSADGLFSSTDGASWSAVSKGMHTTDIPTGSLLTVWQNKLWLAGDWSNPTTVYFCAPGDATDWDSADDAGSVDIREKDDAAIVALHGGTGFDFQANPGLLVFKLDSTYRISDSGSGAYQTIDAYIGAASKNAVVDLYGEAIFIGRRGIFQTKKISAVVPVGQKLLPLFDPASLDDTTIANWCAGFYGDRVFFSATRVGASNNDLAFEYAPLSGWIVAGSNAMNCYHTKSKDGIDVLLGASPAAAGQAYQLNDGGSDDGADIASWFETRWYVVDNNHQARLNVTRLLFRGLDVKVSVFSDFMTVPQFTAQLSSPSSGSVWDVDAWGQGVWGDGSDVESYSTVYPRRIGRAFKVRFDETSSLTYTKPALLDSGATLTSGSWALYAIDTQLAPLGLS